MFSVSFDDINWDPTASVESSDAPSKSSVPPPDLDFVNDFGAFIDADFSFPEDEVSGENRSSKRTRTDESVPFFKSPFKVSNNQAIASSTTSALNHPFDLDDLLGVPTSNIVPSHSVGGADLIPTESFDTISAEEFSSDDLYDSETTSEYSCDDPLLEEGNWKAPRVGGVMGGKINPKFSASSEWANFDFDAVHDVFDSSHSKTKTTTTGKNKLKFKKVYASKPIKSGGGNKRSRKDSEDDGDTSTVRRRRRKRKVDMEQLRGRIANLLARKESNNEDGTDEKDSALLQEELSVREAILSTFFHYRSTNMLDKAKWSDLVTEDFSMSLPRTIYRSQREEIPSTSNSSTPASFSSSSNGSSSSTTKSEQKGSSPATSSPVSLTSATNILSTIVPDVRNVFGIGALVTDTSFVHAMVEGIRTRVRAQRPELARKRAAGFALNLLLDDNSVKLDEKSGAYKATWRMTTHGLVSAGFSSECAVNGDAIMRFDNKYKMVALELDFDALSFGQQLQRHKLLDPNHLARQSLSLGLTGGAFTGAKVAIGAGGVLAPAPLPVGSRPSAAFMRSFGQACAAVKQANEAVASNSSNGTSSSSPPSAQRVMQMMALNMQLMQAGGAGGVLLPGGGVAGASTTGAKKSKNSTSCDSSGSRSNSTPSSTTTATTTVPVATSSSTTQSSTPVPSSGNVATTSNMPVNKQVQSKKRPVSATVTEVDTANTDSLGLFNLTRSLAQGASQSTASNNSNTGASSNNKMKEPVTTNNNIARHSTMNNATLPLFSHMQKQPLLPTHSQQGGSSPASMMMPPFPFHNMPGFPQLPTNSTTGESGGSNGVNSSFPTTTTPSPESILSLFPYGLPSQFTSSTTTPTGSAGSSTSGNPNNSSSIPTGFNTPMMPLSAAQLSQMFGLLQNNTTFQQQASTNNGSISCNKPSQGQSQTPHPFLGFFPSHLPNSPFPSLPASLGPLPPSTPVTNTATSP